MCLLYIIIIPKSYSLYITTKLLSKKVIAQYVINYSEFNLLKLTNKVIFVVDLNL